MKKLLAMLAVLFVCSLAFAAMDFKDVDALYKTASDNQKVYQTLKEMLSKASDKNDKAEVLWRLSRVCVDLGDDMDKDAKDAKFAIYEEGEAYAIQSIELKKSVEGYLWKCSNIGRWGQTKGVLDSLAKAKPMMADLKVITDDLKCLDCSEAWYVLAILYDSIPGIFGGDSDAAVSYGKLACETIPSDAFYGSTYKDFAEMLHNRNWSASKRASEYKKMVKNWDKNTSNYEKYKYYEGTKADVTPVWSSNKLSSMSDRQEAVEILKYAKKVYETRTGNTPGDKENYDEICELLKSWS